MMGCIGESHHWRIMLREYDCFMTGAGNDFRRFQADFMLDVFRLAGELTRTFRAQPSRRIYGKNGIFVISL